MPYLWWKTLRNGNKAVNVHRMLFGQTVNGKKYGGTIGTGGKPHDDVKKVQRALYKITDAQKAKVRKELIRLQVIHGFVSEKNGKKGLIPW